MRVSENVPQDYMDEQQAIKSAVVITDLLRHLNIKYWFDYGALLGTIRNQSFIPWDTDIEINFNYEKQETLDKLFFKLVVLGFNIKKNKYYVHLEKEGFVGMSLSWFPQNHGTKFLGFICYYLPNFIRKGIIKAVQEFYCKSKNEIIRPDDGEDREQSFHCKVIRQMLPIFFCYKIKKAQLYNFKVDVPEKAEELLWLRYGKEWKVPMKKYRSYTT